ncbi:ABC transporter ATP-binding protein [Paenactinomyces guangxiensis]|uniref:ABC transporter ATP-binding protein n=1 Tax=Paenactinomyces guangxiensis TaxID=1490290 RepID=A0A7W2A959_9BACL|nr:ABC transporter ATP-binding protein [Paenactinomyces guangxiensis]MBA4496291.1 ABC transporter ATP-binding protein [Paenactinomyces guangxiensis]MBH8593344.1 ABC transporter ATP-binding protein [Paenactinomyces guangxiensis]
MTSPSAIQVINLTHTFATKKEEVTAVKSVSFNVAPGEFVVLVGPSGCGKSTLLSLIAGIFPPTHGKILLYGQEINGPSSRTGYMLQKDGLLEWRTVEQNLILGLEIQHQATREKIAHARYLLKQIGLSHVLKHFPAQLSGGMRQRVALVRTLAVQPDILLLDEPLSALDIQNKLYLEELIIQVLQEHKKTAVLVTHDLEEAIAMGDRIMVMGGRPGQIRRILRIPDEIRALSPMKARGHREFRPLFEELWREVERP